MWRMVFSVQCTLYNELGRMCNQKDSMMCLVYAIIVLIRIAHAAGQFDAHKMFNVWPVWPLFDCVDKIFALTDLFYILLVQ